MKLDSNKKRSIRNRKKLKKVNLDRYRITVSKSSKNISAQIIDDSANKTIVSASSNEKKIRENKVKKMEMSKIIGETLAKRAAEKKITKVKKIKSFVPLLSLFKVDMSSSCLFSLSFW